MLKRRCYAQNVFANHGLKTPDLDHLGRTRNTRNTHKLYNIQSIQKPIKDVLENVAKNVFVKINSNNAHPI